ncbi:hypothetical protein KWH04_22125 [Xanthomonas campestris pv. trichodesmae]|uniref:hypothetical protein n=1 Tax=Xanthomonas TaxID=338 RepID=UPI0012FE29D2|nr:MULTISPECIES: hypothetical protein [Xanthomonas]MBV6783265.1 hypothetical protein [Xanthomonas campestris pv. trichodesmae]MBV6888613.1 hypothetical protein [Xanthomonas campestris pv. spermacoces]
MKPTPSESLNPLRSIVDKLIPDLGEELKGSALSATFQLACHGFICSEYFSNAEEEATTGALLGAIAATAPWCFEAFSQEPDFNWIRFSKSGNSENAEPSTGADFALILRIEKRLSRLAIFQAKSADKKGNFSVHQISPERAGENKIPEPQFIRLMDFAKNVDKAIPLTRSSSKLLDWVHYIAYEPDAIIATPLSALRSTSEHYEAYRFKAKSLYEEHLTKRYPNTGKTKRTTRRKSREDPPIIDHTVASSAEKSQVAADVWSAFEPHSICSRDHGIHLVSLLTIGASPTRHRLPGWLELTSSMQLGKLVKAINGRMDIYVGRANDKIDLDLTLGEILDKTLKSRLTRREKISAELKNSVSSELKALLSNAQPKPGKSIQTHSKSRPGPRNG